MLFKEYIEKWYCFGETETFPTWKNKMKQLYLETLKVDEINKDSLMFNEQTINFIVNTFEKKLIQLYDYNFLYEYDSLFAKARLDEILQFAMFRLTNELKAFATLSSSKLDENINQTITEAITTAGYSGWDVENQDGDFQSNKNTSSQKSSDVFSFFNLANRRIKEFGNDAIMMIKKDLLQVIY